MNFYNLKLYLDDYNKSIITITQLAKRKETHIGIVGLSALPNLKNIDFQVIPALEIPKYNILLYAKNQKGYHNLIRLSHGNLNLRIISKCREGTILVAPFHDDRYQLWNEDYYLSIIPKKDFQKYNYENFQSGNQLVCLNDTYYLERIDFLIYKKFYSDMEKDAWFKNLDDIYNAFDKSCLHIPYQILLDSIANTEKIVKQCEPIQFLSDKKFSIPFEKTDFYFKKLVYRKFKRLKLSEIYEQRLNQELELYCEKGLVNYILIIYDLINHIDSMFNLRGSAVASLVLYVLGINPIDPIQHNLLFERFLNHNRDELPDIDLEIENNKRDEAILYLKQKYTYVYQMGVYTHWGKSSKVLKDVIRRFATHPTAIIIVNESLKYDIPLCDGCIAWEYKDMKLAKFDLISSNVLHNIRCAFEELDIGFENIDFNNSKIYKEFALGNTDSIFQFNADLAKKILQNIKPENFEQLVACCALNRPMALTGDFPEAYADYKNRIDDPKYLHPCLCDVLSDTYSLPIYQEQILQIVNKVTGLSFDDADVFRKVISKKEVNEIKFRKLKRHFIKKAGENGLDQKTALQIFEYIELYSKYGFNKAHSVSYVRIAYVCMWLKIYHLDTFKKYFS